MRRGDQVGVLTEPAQAARPADLRVIPQPLRGWRDLGSVLRRIREEAPSMVQLEYSQYGWHRFGCALWLNALFLTLALRGVRTRLALHEFPLGLLQHPAQLPIALLQRLHFWLLGLCADQVRTNTLERVAALRRWYPWRSASGLYRPNSNCNPVFPISNEARLRVRRNRGATGATLIVACYGLYASAKNYEAIVAAVAQLAERFDLHLWLLGDSAAAAPDYLMKLRAAAQPLGERVFWSGPLSSQAVSAHLQAADIFVLPQPDGHLTRSGSFMAAAAHGLPVIAVRNDRNQREFAHARDVWLVARSSAQEFAQAIAALARDADLRQNLGDQLHKLYPARFAWDAALAPVRMESQPHRPSHPATPAAESLKAPQ